MQDSDNSAPPRRRRGPPPFKPTPKQRKDVALYAAGGMSEPAIAREIGICQNTLRKHFADELDQGHQRELAANLRRLRKAADRGNVTAMKHLDAKFGVIAAHKEFDNGAAPTKEPRVPKIGKKEEAAQAALTAGEGSVWGDDLKVPGTSLN